MPALAWTGRRWTPRFIFPGRRLHRQDLPVYREKVTGAHNDRRELLKTIKALAPGDVVTVTRIAPSTDSASLPTAEIDRRTKGLSTAAAGAGRDARRTRA